MLHQSDEGSWRVDFDEEWAKGPRSQPPAEEEGGAARKREKKQPPGRR